LVTFLSKAQAIATGTFIAHVSVRSREGHQAMFKSKSTVGVTKMLENRAVNLFGLFYEHLAPNLDQADLDSLHQNLRMPLKNINRDIDKYARTYPLLKKMGAKRIGWLMLQAADVLHLGISLLNHPDVSSQSKAKLTVALAYFIWPFDLLPEGLIGPIGYADDVIVMVWVIDSILNGKDEKEKRLIRRIWQGSSKDLFILRTYLSYFDVLKAMHTVLKQYSFLPKKK
jgi:uncharacterized membrane protein YkvA (DUF1232 family)